MASAHKDVEELLRLLLIYMPTAVARQLIGDIYRSNAAKTNANLCETMRRLAEQMDRTYPVLDWKLTGRRITASADEGDR